MATEPPKSRSVAAADNMDRNDGRMPASAHRDIDTPQFVTRYLSKGPKVDSRKFSWLGLGFIAFGLFVLLIAIPYAVTSPSNVRVAVLAPTFWPVIVSWLIIGLGALLILTRLLGRSTVPGSEAPAASGLSEPEAFGLSEAAAPSLRLLATAAVMIGLVWITPTLGMVWTTMIAFALLSVIIKSSKPILSCIVAVLLPFILYAFFSHVAGVAVPQGEFIQLP